MVIRHLSFKADVAEYRFLLLFVSKHNHFLNDPLVENIVTDLIIQPFSRNC